MYMCYSFYGMCYIKLVIFLGFRYKSKYSYVIKDCIFMLKNIIDYKKLIDFEKWLGNIWYIVLLLYLLCKLILIKKREKNILLMKMLFFFCIVGLWILIFICFG